MKKLQVMLTQCGTWSKHEMISVSVVARVLSHGFVIGYKMFIGTCVGINQESILHDLCLIWSTGRWEDLKNNHVKQA